MAGVLRRALRTIRRLTTSKVDFNADSTSLKNIAYITVQSSMQALSLPRADLGSVPLPVLGTYYDWQIWGVPTYLPFLRPYSCPKAGWGRANIPTYPLAPHGTSHTKYPTEAKGHNPGLRRSA